MEHIPYHKFRHCQIIRGAALLQKAIQIVIAFIFHGIQPVLQFPDTCGCPNIPLEKQYKSKKYHCQQNEKGIKDIFQFYSFHPILLIAPFIFQNRQQSLPFWKSVLHGKGISCHSGRKIRSQTLSFPGSRNDRLPWNPL